MGPVQKLVPITITPVALSAAAVSHCKVRVSQQQVITALGAISNLYCLYALDHSDSVQISFDGFTSPTVASRSAVLIDIRRALPGSSTALAEAILTALAKSLDELFLKREAKLAMLSAFGCLVQTQAEPSQYELQIVLPLAQYLGNGGKSLNRSAGAAGD